MSAAQPGRRATEEHDEKGDKHLALQLIELHFIPTSRARMKNIDFTVVRQQNRQRRFNSARQSPGSHPIAVPITVVISGPIAPITILSGDGSAIPPSVASATHTWRACAFATGSMALQGARSGGRGTTGA